MEKLTPTQRALLAYAAQEKIYRHQRGRKPAYLGLPKDIKGTLTAAERLRALGYLSYMIESYTRSSYTITDAGRAALA